MKQFSFFIAGIISVITLAGIHSCKPSSKASTSKFLKFNLEKGKGYDYEMRMDMNSKTGGVDTKMSMDGAYSMNVSDINNGVRSVTTSYKSLKMHIEAMGMTIDIDSNEPTVKEDSMKKDPLGAMQKIIGSLVGKPFVIKVDEEGKVLEINGFDKIISDMIDSMGLNAEERAQAIASMKDQFSDQSMKDNFAQMFTIFPNKEVKIGDSWEKTYTNGGKLPIKLITTYTVKEIEGDHVTLATKSKIESNEADMEIGGDQKGNIIVDSNTGLMVNAEYDGNMEIKTQGITSPVTLKVKIKGKAN